MAAPLKAFGRLLCPTGSLTPTLSRTAFTARKHDPNNPNWVNVGLALASTVAVWALLFKQHNEYTVEYERRQAERGS